MAECHGHCSLILDDARTAKARFLEARRTQQVDRIRTRSYTEADLAIAYLRDTHVDVEAALAAGDRSVTMARQLESGRISSKLSQLDRELSRHGRIVAVREWRAQAAPLLHRRAPTIA